MRRYFSFVMVLAMLLSSVCLILQQGIQAEAQTAKERGDQTAKQIVEEMQKKTREMKSGRISAVFDARIEAGEEAAELKVEFRTAFTSEPIKMKFDMYAEGVLDGETDFKEKEQIYLVQEGNNLYQYYEASDGSFKKSKMDLEEIFFAANAMQHSAAFMENMEYRILSDSTKVGSKEAYLIEGTLSASKIKELLLEEAGNTLDDTEALEDALDNRIADFTLKYWIDKETMEPIKVTVDLREYLKRLLKGLIFGIDEDVEDMETPGINISRSNLVIYYDDLNQIKDIAIPKEGKQAEKK